jgi:hypothetical protein
VRLRNLGGFSQIVRFQEEEGCDGSRVIRRGKGAVGSAVFTCGRQNPRIELMTGAVLMPGPFSRFLSATFQVGAREHSGTLATNDHERLHRVKQLVDIHVLTLGRRNAVAPNRRERRQQDGMLVPMFMGAQRFAQAGKRRRRRPLVSIDANRSVKGERRDWPRIRQMRVAVKGGKRHHKETLDERTQRRAWSLLEKVHFAVEAD